MADPDDLMLVFGVFARPFSEQLSSVWPLAKRPAGKVLTKSWDADAQAILRLSVRRILTERQVEAARKTLAKKIGRTVKGMKP